MSSPDGTGADTPSTASQFAKDPANSEINKIHRQKVFQVWLDVVLFLRLQLGGSLGRGRGSLFFPPSTLTERACALPENSCRRKKGSVFNMSPRLPIMPLHQDIL